MMNDTVMECGTLVQVEVMMSKFMAGHATDGVDEIVTVQVFKPVLVRVVGVQATVKVHRGRVLDPVLITSIL